MNNWEEHGINDVSNFVGFLYEPNSKTLIAHFNKNIGQGYGIKSLWARHLSDDTYGRITPARGYFSYEDAVISQNSEVYVNVLEIKIKNGAYDGYEWNSIMKINLKTKEMVELVNKNDISISPPFSKIWISTIHSISLDSKEIYCSIAHQGKSNIEDSIKTEYYLSKFLVDDGRYERITKLGANIL
ncbi:MAG: hypothetical protein AAF462_08690 [Thermodesulfobacteriota bacterium]